MNYANKFYTFPKIVDILFRRLLVLPSESCGYFIPRIADFYSVRCGCLYYRLLRFWQTRLVYDSHTGHNREAE